MVNPLQLLMHEVWYLIDVQFKRPSNRINQIKGLIKDLRGHVHCHVVLNSYGNMSMYDTLIYVCDK